jgi:hypothetical protein
MGAVRDLLDRMRSRATEAPQSIDPGAGPVLFGYTEESLESRMLKAYEAGQESRFALAADAAASSEGDEQATTRFATQRAADLQTMSDFHNDWQHGEMTSPAQLRGLTEVAEIYGRWRDTEPRISEWVPWIDVETAVANSPVEEQAGQARQLPIQLPLLEDIRGKFSWEYPREGDAVLHDEQIARAALRVPVDVDGDTPGQALAREYLSSVSGIFSAEAATKIADQISSGEADQIRTQFGPNEPVFTPRQEVAHQARELIADAAAAAYNLDALSPAPALQSEHEAVLRSVEFLGHDAQRHDHVTAVLYERATELDNEAARLTHDANGAPDHYESQLRAEAAAKSAEAYSLRTEAAVRREHDSSRSIDGSSAETVQGGPSVVERAERVRSSVSQLNDLRDAEVNDAGAPEVAASRGVTR